MEPSFGLVQRRVFAVSIRKGRLSSSRNGIIGSFGIYATRSSNSDGGRRAHGSNANPDEALKGSSRIVRDVIVIGGGVAAPVFELPGGLLIMCRRILGGERHRHAIARPDQLSRDPMVAVGVMDAVVESGRNLALRSTLSGNTEIIEATVEGLRWEEGRGGGSGVAAHLSPPSPKPSASTLEGVGSEFKPGFRWTGAFDLVVGADGADSFVRRVTVGGGGDDGDATPERRGYVVYRGVCAGSAVGCEGREGGAQEQWGSESFQTWGPGLRFASVPLAGDERMWFATVADGVFPAGNTPPAVSIKPFLLETFGAWHEPISNLLRSTRDEDILCEDARAMSARGLRLVASSRYADSPSVERGERGQQWRSSVVLVGDAAHMLDPVLAQGAGVALEDAFLLARYLKDYNDSLEHSLGASKMSTGVKGAGIETVLARYDEERLRRVLLLSRLSDLSQSLGHLRPPGLARLRNSLASLAPSVARSLIFDCFMATSLAGGSRGAVRAAAAAIGWGRGDARFGGFRIPDL